MSINIHLTVSHGAKIKILAYNPYKITKTWSFWLMDTTMLSLIKWKMNDEFKGLPKQSKVDKWGTRIRLFLFKHYMYMHPHIVRIMSFRQCYLTSRKQYMGLNNAINCSNAWCTDACKHLSHLFSCEKKVWTQCPHKHLLQKLSLHFFITPWNKVLHLNILTQWQAYYIWVYDFCWALIITQIA